MQAKGSKTHGVLQSANAMFGQGPPAYNVPSMQTPQFNPTQRNAWDIQMAGGQAGVEGAINNAQYSQGAADLYQNQMLGGGNALQGSYGQGGGDVGGPINLQNDWSQWNNPNFQGAVKGYQDSMGEAFQRYTLPQQEMNAIGQGGFGSTRHGIAQGLATSDFMNQMGRGTQEMYSNQYNLGQDRYLQADMADQRSGMANQQLNANQYNMGQDRGLRADMANQNAKQNAWQGAVPFLDRRQQANLGVPDALNNMGNVYGNIGNQQYGRDAGQAAQQYQEGVNKWNYESQAPLNYMNAYANQVYGSPQDGGSSQGGGGGSSWAADMLGGAQMGMGMYNSWNEASPGVPDYTFNQNQSPQFGGANSQIPTTWK